MSIWNRLTLYWFRYFRGGGGGCLSYRSHHEETTLIPCNWVDFENCQFIQRLGSKLWRRKLSYVVFVFNMFIQWYLSSLRHDGKINIHDEFEHFFDTCWAEFEKKDFLFRKNCLATCYSIAVGKTTPAVNACWKAEFTDLFRLVSQLWLAGNIDTQGCYMPREHRSSVLFN